MTAIESLLHHPAVLRLSLALLHFLWQGVALAAIALVVLVAMRRSQPTARYVALLLVLAAMAATPAVTFFVLPGAAQLTEASAPMAAAVPVSNESAALPADLSASPPGVLPGSGRAHLPTSAEPSPATAHPRSTLAGDWLDASLAWVAAGWFLGVFILSLRLLVGWAGVARLRRRGVEPAGDDWRPMLARLAERLRIRRPVRLLESAVAEVPTVLGWLRPVILLPASALSGLTAGQIEALIAHELAHIRRCDYLVNLLQTVVETLLFYHPAVWWVSHRIRGEREHCCDDLAVACCGDALTYARALAQMEHLRSAAPQLALAARGGSLLSRIRRLAGGTLAPGRSTSWPAGFLAIGAVIALGAALTLSVVTARGYGAARHEKPSAVLFPIYHEAKGGYIDNTGKIVIKPQFDLASRFSEGLAGVCVGRTWESGGKWGYIDETGKMVIKPQFRSAEAFSEGLACVTTPDGKTVYIDKTGKIVIRLQSGLPYASPFSEGLALVQVGKKYGYINKKGEMVMKPRYAVAGEFAEGLAPLYVGKRGTGKYGYVNRKGKMVIKPQFDYAYPFSEGVASVSVGAKSGNLGGKWRYIDKRGRTVITPTVNSRTAFPFYEGLALLKITEGEYVYIDKSGKIVLRPKCDYSGDFSDGLAFVRIGGKTGYMDKTGKIVIKPQFDSASKFENGVARAGVRGKYGYVDTTGRVVIEPRFAYAGEFREGLARVNLGGEGLGDGIMGGRWLYIDKSGRTVIEAHFDHLEDFSDGLARVQVGGGYAPGTYRPAKYGYIGRTGKTVIEPQYEQAGDFSEGLARVQVNCKWGYIDKTGSMAINPQFEEAFDFHERLGLVKSGGKWGWIDRTGKIVIQPQFDTVSRSGFAEGRAKIRINKKWGYIDRTGKIIIKPQYGGPCNFSEGLVPVSIGGKDGYIDRMGRVAIAPRFDRAGAFHDGLAPVNIRGKEGYIDKTGRTVIPLRFDDALNFGDGLAPVKVGIKWRYIDKKGNWVTDQQFDEAWLFSEGMATVRLGAKSGYIDKAGKYIWVH